MLRVQMSLLISLAVLQPSMSMTALTRSESKAAPASSHVHPKYQPEYPDSSADDSSKVTITARDTAAEKPDSDAPFKQLVNGSTPTGWVQIGTPKKWLYVIFDTGSDKLVAKTWETIAAELSSVDQGVSGMLVPSDKIYNHESSNTYEHRYIQDSDNNTVPEEASITYGSGTAITEVGQDTITVGNRELQNFTLMEITADSLQLLHTSTGVAGVLGLQHMMNRSLGHSLFSRLRDADKMTAFGYCRGTGNNGTFIWGAAEPTGSSGKAVDVVGQMHWAVKLGSVSVDGAKAAAATKANTSDSTDTSDSKDTSASGGWESFSKSNLLAKKVTNLAATVDDPDFEDVNNEESSSDVDSVLEILTTSCKNMSCLGILDSGSNIIAGPSDVMKAASDLLNVQPDCSNFDQLPTITLNFGGYPMKVPPSGYVMKIPKSEVSQGGDDDSQDGESGGGLAEKTSSDAQSAIKRQWMATFERLKKKRGIDFGDVLKSVLKHENATKEEFLCMPALVPLDKHTVFGPLYIVGTPALQNYYARWSFDKNASNPKIHMQPLQEAEACKDDSNAHVGDSVPTSKLMRHQHHAHDSHGQHLSQHHHGQHHHGQHHHGPRDLLIDEIRYPHWAENLLHL
jgi:hypothetical protein